MTVRGVVTGEDGGVEDGFGGVGLGGLSGAVFGVGVEGLHLRPVADALFEITHQCLLGCAFVGFAKVVSQGGAQQGVRELGVAGDADGSMVSLGFGPGLPPELAGVEIGSCGLLVPTDGRGFGCAEYDRRCREGKREDDAGQGQEGHEDSANHGCSLAEDLSAISMLIVAL